MPTTAGTVEQPTLFLNTLTGEPICPIVDRANLAVQFKYNDVSELSFEVADKILVDDEWQENPCFDEIRGMRTVYLEPFGVFILINPSISADGIQRIKSCTAYSLEYELNYKTMPAIEGTYLFHDPTGNNDNTITAIILEQVPNWSIGHIDTSVATRYRTFDESANSLYSFMMNTLQDSYGCIFQYDTRRRIINIYDMDTAVENVPVYLSSNNLLTSQNIDELSDEIVTCLAVYGADDESIASVNPLGSDKIYNLDYFIEIGDIPETIATKWKVWKSNFDTYQSLFSNLFAQYYSNLMIYNTQNALLVDLNGELSSLNHVLDTYKTDTGGDHAAEIAETEAAIVKKQAEVDEQSAVVSAAKTKSDTALESMQNIVKLCAFEKFLTADEIKTINAYIKEDTLEDATYVVSYVDGDVAAANKITSSNTYSVSIKEGKLYKAADYKDLTPEEMEKLEKDGGMTPAEINELINITNNISQTYLGWNFYSVNYGKLSVRDLSKEFELTGTVVNSTFAYKDTANEDGTHDCVVTFSVDTPDYNGETPSTAELVASGTCSLSTVTDTSLEVVLKSGIVSLTSDSTIYQRQTTIQDLYNYGKSMLHDLAYPAYEFEVDSANFMWNADFPEFRENIALGKSVNIEFKDGFFLSPILTEMDFNFDDATDFKLVFSNKIYSTNPEFKLADVIGESAKTSSSLNNSKFSYKAFTNSNVQNDVEKIMNEALDVAKNAIVNSNGQNISIDDGGIHLVKVTNKITGELDPCEIRLVNNQIVFTDDSWDSAKLAIGKIKTNPDSETYTMGVVGESLIGNILIGNKLRIESTGTDPVTGKTNVNLFSVDEKGATLNNSILKMEGSEGNKMLFDPNIGCAFGGANVYYDESGTLKYGFMDYTDPENPVLKFDKDASENNTVPSGTSFFYDLDNDKAYFKGDVYANNGYFKGAVKCTSLDCTNATITGLSGSFDMTGGSVNISTSSYDTSVIKLNGKNNRWSELKTGTLYLADEELGLTCDVFYGGMTASDDSGYCTQIGARAIHLNDVQISSESDGVYITESFLPMGQYDLGSATSQWNNIYANNITCNGAKVATSDDLSGYAKKSHDHSGSDISGGYPSVSSVYLTDPGTASSVAVYRSTSSGILGIPSSSRRYKNSIAGVTEETLKPERLYDLPVRQFKWNDGHFGEEENYDYSTVNIGFIAEEVAKIYPFAAVVMNGEIETWEARNLLPPMLALIQQQKKEIDELRERIDAIEAQ